MKRRGKTFPATVAARDETKAAVGSNKFLLLSLESEKADDDVEDDTPVYI